MRKQITQGSVEPLQEASFEPQTPVTLVPTRRKKQRKTYEDIACSCRNILSSGACPASGDDAVKGRAQQQQQQQQRTEESSACCPYYAAPCWRLYSFQGAPATLQFNRFIRTGYRAGLSYRECLRSVLQVHNETGNILSHLLPAALILALLRCGLLAVWEGAELEFWWNVGSILLCFCLSAAYHCFAAHHHVYQTWLKIDVCGVLQLMVGCGHAVIWWGLLCHPMLRLLCTLGYCAAGAACLAAAAVAAKHTRWHRSARVLGPQLVMLAVRQGSLAVRALLGARHPRPSLRHFVLMDAYNLLGGIINTLRIPERWLQPADPTVPAPLDLWFNSHQVMHLLTAMAAQHLYWGAAAEYRTVTELREGRLQC